MGEGRVEGHWVPLLISLSYPFLILLGVGPLSSHYVILLPSYSAVSGWVAVLLLHMLPSTAGKCLHALSEIRFNLEKTRGIWHPEPNLRTTGTEVSKTHTTQTNGASVQIPYRISNKLGNECGKYGQQFAYALKWCKPITQLIFTKPTFSR